ncbi:exo-alpha-sialidase [Termitidicoccus mucosus]|uniref:Sialidase domain-containing protein n=1 Tax=Termitidicoccus mucosus TaxID=1184151 RepID=A0A178ICH5_9BACT|nr:hypothetical protein AW736_20925 [Opitutaceae bacterium TSB47]
MKIPRIPGVSSMIPCLAFLAVAALRAHAADAPAYWSGRALPDLNWSTLSNWNRHVPLEAIDGTLPVVFDRHSAAEGRRAPNLDFDARVAAVRFHGGGFTLRSDGARTLALALSATTAATAPLLNITGENTIGHRVAFTSGVANARAIHVDSGTLVFGPSGALDFNGALKPASGIALTYVSVNAGARLETNGPLVADSAAGGAGTARLCKEGEGDWVIGGTNNNLSRFGDLRVHGGRVVLDGSNALGSLTITNNPGSSGGRGVVIARPGASVANPVNFTNGAAAATAMVGGLNTTGTVAFTGRVSLASAGTDAGLEATEFFAAEGGTVVFRGVIANNHNTTAGRQGGVDKTGAGTVIFEGDNTYSLGTRVSAGTLLFNNTAGSAAGPGDVIVGEATVGGNGAISGALVAGGTASVIAPGGGAGCAGRVLRAGALDAARGVTLRGGPGGARLDLAGTLTGGGALVFDFAEAPASAPPGTLWTPVTFGAAQNVSVSQLRAANLPAGVEGAFAVTANTIEFLVGAGAPVIPSDPLAPPLGLKTYTDLGVMVDETMLAAEIAGGATPGGEDAAGPDGTREFAMADAGNKLRLGLGGTPSARWFAQPNVLWCCYSKDNGATWSEPRFVAAAVSADAADGSAGIPARDIADKNVRAPENSASGSIRALRSANDWEVFFTTPAGRTIGVSFREDDVRRMATAADLLRAPRGKFARESVAADKAGTGEDVMAARVCVAGDVLVDTAHPPDGYRLDEAAGMLVGAAADTSALHRAQQEPGTLYGVRSVRAPNGELLVLIPDGWFASTLRENANKQTALRSADGGATWRGPTFPFGETGKHYSAPLIVDRGTGRLFAFETLREVMVDGVARDAAYGWSVSDDSGVTWSAPEVIRRADNGGIWNGVGVIPATQTAAGTWVIGFHHGRVLRGELAEGGARRWTMPEFPRAAHPEFIAEINHLDELSVLATGGAALYAQYRTNAGFLGEMRSADDAATWGSPALTPLAQPDAPPMLFRLSDGRLIALHHNRAVRRTVAEPVHSEWLTMPAPTGAEIAERRAHPLSLNDWASRAEIWFSLSSDNGATWGESRLLLANALDETLKPANPNYQCSYADVVAADGVLHVFVPHRWQKVVHLKIDESRLGKFKTRAEFHAAAGQ